MRTTLLTGAALLVAAVLVVILSSELELELESVALMGAATGAVVALVPDRTPGPRVISFVLGFLAAWAGYVVRAAALPDTTGGHAVSVALVVVLCVAVAASTGNRLPLWGALLGAATLAGTYEATYVNAPSQVLATSYSTSTSVLLDVAIGFLAAALVAPLVSARREAAPTSESEPAHDPKQTRASEPGETPLNDLMEDAR